MTRLAVVTTHPVQYYAPWFRRLAEHPGITLRVFYLWNPQRNGFPDPEFGTRVEWDVPLLEGYDYSWLENRSRTPGTDHFRGIDCPQAVDAVAQWKPDRVLCLGYQYAAFYRLLFSRTLCDIPFLIRGDSHRLLPATFKQHLKDTAIRMLFARFQDALYCGHANRRYFSALGFDGSHLHFCPHGVDEQRFKPLLPGMATSEELKKRWGVPDGHSMILFSGKLISKKRPDLLLQAFERLGRSDVTLVFAGSGEMEPKLKSKAGERVVFHSFINQSEMPSLYHAADLTVLPSEGPYETWGLSVQESLACGTPVVVSDHVGCHEDLVVGQNNGAVFPAGDAPALAACLRLALEGDTLARWKAHTSEPLKLYTYERAVQGVLEAVLK